jgi:hypothetical protein
LKLKITNHTNETRRFVWPDDFQLWLVNATGARVLTATDIEAPREELTLAPGAVVERSIPFDSGALEGEPWGTYRAFVELGASREGQPRVPSSPVTFQWRLQKDAVLALLRQAAAGHQTGLRNSPLKLLRVYVAEIVPMLDAIPLAGLTAEEARLASQLRIAGCLKPNLPTPGLLGLDTRVPAQGPWRFNAPGVIACLGGEASRAKLQLTGLLAVRRHLGWEVALTLRPDEAATLLSVRVALSDIDELRTELASEPRAVISLSSNRVSTIGFPSTVPSANLVVRLGIDTLEVARRLPDPDNPAQDFVAADTLEDRAFLSLADSAAFSALLADGRLRSPRAVVFVPGSLTWGQLLARIDPLLQRGVAVDAIVR